MRVQFFRRSAITAACIVCMCHANSAAAYELSHGRQVLLNHGLQLQALTFYNYAPVFSDVARWESANFSTINYVWLWFQIPGYLANMPANQPWGRFYDPGVALRFGDGQPYVNNLVNLQYSDEPADLTSPARLNDMAATYAEWRAAYPNTLAHSNFYGGQYSSATLAQYMQTTHPDMLLFDYYPNFSFSTTRRNNWYSYMQQYRTLALAGYDGTGRQPIPYGQYLNLFRNSYSDALPSESFVRLQQFASWAFGYTFTSAFIYNQFDDPNVFPAMFSSAGDTSPTVVFDYVAGSNRESQNLGPALVRLVSTGVFMKPGSGQSVSGTGLSAWSSKAGTTSGYADYITSITPYTNSTANGGTVDSTYKDVLVGYFKPLLDDNAGCTFADGLHFMIVNGSASGSATASAQWYHLGFDFAGSDFDALVRLSRDSSEVELVPLTHIGDRRFYLDLYLPGGTGDLFAFWNSADPLPSIPEPNAFTLMGIGAIGLLAYARIRRK